MTLPSATALHIESRQPTTAEILAYAASRKNKWFSPQREPRKSAEAKPALRLVKPDEALRGPLHQQDSHMAAYYEWKGNEPLGFLKLRCRELDLDLERIVGMTRKRHEAEVRGLLMAEIKIRHPDMSLHAIGKLFGGRDRTTILHFLHKHGIREAPRPRTAVSYLDTVQKMFFEGALYNDIAVAIKRSPSTVSNIVKEKGWTRTPRSLADNAETIRAMFEAGLSTRDIAPAVGYSHVHVGAFIRTMGWTR